MALARLVVIEGPDLGRSFDLPMRGGVIGRGDGCVVALSDLAVSRQHSTLACATARCAWSTTAARTGRWSTATRSPSTGSRPATRSSWAGPGWPTSRPRADRDDAPGRKVTMEVGSRELMSLGAVPGRRRGPGPAPPGVDRRARRSAARRGRGRPRRGRPRRLRGVPGRARRRPRVPGRPRRRGAPGTPVAAAIAPGDPLGAQLHVPSDLVAKVMTEGKALTSDVGDAARRGPAPGPDRGGRRRRADRAALGRAARPGLGPARPDGGGLHRAPGRRGDGRRRRPRPARARRPPRSRSGSATATSSAGRRRRARCSASSPGSGRPTRPCCSPARPAPARSWSRARSTGPAAARGGPVRRGQLRRAHREPARERAVRPREGRVHRRDREAGRPVRAGRRRHAVPRRDRRAAARRCRPSCCACSRSRRFERVGGDAGRSTVDVRVVAATNRDLAGRWSGAASFREDLFYRLSVVHIEVPPLRERRDDIPLLAEHFLAPVPRRRSARTDHRLRARGAAPLLPRYAWPGNVRELRNAVERAVVLGDGERIGPADLPPQIAAAHRGERRHRLVAPAAAARRNSPPTAAAALRDLVGRAPRGDDRSGAARHRGTARAHAEAAAREEPARARARGHPRRARRDRRQQGPGRRDPRDRPLDPLQEAQGLRDRDVGFET